MKKILIIPFTALLLFAGCSKDEGCDHPDPNPSIIEPAPVSVWDGKSATEPFDINPTYKTATIRLASDLAWLSQQSNASVSNTFEGWTFTLGQNIDLADKNWTPIGQWSAANPSIFKGTFDGNGHSIVGLYVDNPEQVNNGLFGVTQQAIIKDLQVTGTVRGDKQIGGICANAQLSTLIENCRFSGKLESSEQGTGYTAMGGICGWTENEVKVLNCHSSATIVYGADGLTDAGGVVAIARKSSEIRNCSFSGTFEKGRELSQKAHMGGIVGRLETSYVSACKNTADIAIEGNVQIFLGGIAGLVDKNTCMVGGCYNTGALNNKSTADGLTGGIAGALGVSCYITACYNTGEITPSPTEVSLETENREITFWTQENSLLLDCFYTADKPETAGARRFTATQWPSPLPTSSWNIGNDPKAGKYWKSLGKPGTEELPVLWWE